MVRFLAGLFLAACLAGPAHAAFIDFETGFVDDEPFTGTEFSGDGVNFEPAAGISLAIEATGSSATDTANGFVYNGAAAGAESFDTDATGAGRLGGFFLRRSGDFSNTVLPNGPLFSIAYSAAPTGAISGEIWDIDVVTQQGAKDPNEGTEQWRVLAYDAGGTEIGRIDSPVGDDFDLDALPWTFTFLDADLAGGLANLDRIDIAFVGTKETGVGVAFDNFASGIAPVPLPAPVLLLAGALGALALAGRRRTSAGAVTPSTAPPADSAGA